MGRLLVIDGHAYAYRAFHAIRRLTSPEGRPTNAIFGFIKMLTRLRGVFRPTHLLVVWDGGLNAERLAALPGYKAQRPDMPADLRAQLDEIADYLQAARITSYRHEGVEADDYIACVVKKSVAHGLGVLIASSDKDFMQLVSPSVGLVNPSDKTEVIWGEAEVRGKSGVEPGQLVDWLSLMGDGVDNIPGVPGVGAKTAAELLSRFGSVGKLYERLDEVNSKKLCEALQASADTVKRNMDLVRLKDDLPCDFSPEELVDRLADTGRLRELYRRWGFESLLAELESAQQGVLW
jgi:DNA polymerase-1